MLAIFVASFLIYVDLCSPKLSPHLVCGLHLAALSRIKVAGYMLSGSDVSPEDLQPI